MASLIAQVDSQLEQLFSSWNLYSTLLVIVLLLLFAYPVFTYREPDTHPLLLSRQANIAMVRMPGESAVYRSLEVPHGLPLRSGLNVKEEGQGRWIPGKDGDVRDVWRRVVNGTISDNGKATGQKSTIQTVYGREDIETHDTKDLTKQLNAIGTHLKDSGATTLAICLPNSVELLLSIFLAAFYGFTPILLPYGIPNVPALELAASCKADVVIAEAGTIPLTDIKTKCKDVKQVLWVVEKTSRHMDWNQNESNIRSTTWHDLVEGSKSVSEETPVHSDGQKAPGIVTIWLNKTSTSGDIVSFSQQNIVAAAAAQISALPLRHRFSPDDLFLPADSMAQPYILAQTLAALYSGVSLALNSVAGPDVELPLAAAGISPTIIAASSASALKLHNKTNSNVSGSVRKFALSSQKQALQAGYMAPSTVGSGMIRPTRATLGKVPSKLRLLYVFERAHAGTPRLSYDVLTELRAFTGARIIYGLSAAKVAGTVSQTQFYDYRHNGRDDGEHSHFGVPVSSVELKLTDTDTHKNVEGQRPLGEVCLRCLARVADVLTSIYRYM